VVALVSTPAGFGQLQGLMACVDRRHSRGLIELTYPQLMARGDTPSGAYVFADRERMNPVQQRIAASLWDQLAGAADRVRLLNHPMGQLGRLELLAILAKSGVNDFRGFLASDLPEDLRYPVFVRCEADHDGPRTDLLRDRAELGRELSRLVLEGHAPARLLVVEYLDTSDSNGVFRKFGALRIGNKVLAHHLMLSKDWNVKHDSRIWSDDADREAREYIAQNPHEQDLKTLFEVAAIEYGRIDYSFLDGRIQVWEINDNPSFASLMPRKRPEAQAKRVRALETLRSLSDGLPENGRIAIGVDFEAICRWLAA